MAGDRAYGNIPGLERLKKTKLRKRHGEPASELQKMYNKYIMAATSLDETVSASQVLELYRIRRQTGLAVKWLKSLFRYGEVLVKREERALTWFYGKLVLAALGETAVNTGRFSP